MPRSSWPARNPSVSVRIAQCVESTGFLSTTRGGGGGGPAMIVGGRVSCAIAGNAQSTKMRFLILFHAGVTGRVPIRHVDRNSLLAVAGAVVRRALDRDHRAFIRLRRDAKRVGGVAVQSFEQNAAVARDANAPGGADFADLRLAVLGSLGEGQAKRENSGGDAEKLHEASSMVTGG